MNNPGDEGRVLRSSVAPELPAGSEATVHPSSEEPERRPWEGLNERRASTPAERRTFFEIAHGNPCMDCSTSPCCWFAHLAELSARTWTDFDYMRYLSNFDGLELLVDRRGHWGLWLRRPCSHLHPESLLCQIRGTREHPELCRAYSPFDCWYRKTLELGSAGQTLRLDADRLDRVLTALRFDSVGAAVESPTLDQMIALAASPAGSGDERPPPTEGTEKTAPSRHESPCRSCGKPCCVEVRIPRRTPRDRRDLLYLRFLLGFPGIELFISDRSWSLVIAARCRHFDLASGACRLFGSKDRPRRCEFTDEWRCETRAQASRERRDGVWIRGADVFEIVESQIRCDAEGRIRGMPGARELKSALDRLAEAPERRHR